MNKKHFAAIFTFLLSSLCTEAARERNYSKALSSAGDRRAVVAFCYGANYDKYSEKKYDDFIKKRKILRGIGSNILVEVPIYQLPNKKERKERDRIMGDKKLPGGIYSYPSIAIIDGENNLRAVIQSAEELKDAETASKILNDYLDKFDEQQKILKKADGRKSDKVGEIIAEAADLGLNIPERYIKQGQGATDDAGHGHRFNFNWEPLLVEMDKMGSPGDAVRKVRELMDKASYTKEQRQELLAVLTGFIRRSTAKNLLTNPSPQRDALEALYYEMHAIDPKSAYGSYALQAIEIWLRITPEGERPD